MIIYRVIFHVYINFFNDRNILVCITNDNNTVWVGCDGRGHVFNLLIHEQD